MDPLQNLIDQFDRRVSRLEHLLDQVRLKQSRTCAQVAVLKAMQAKKPERTNDTWKVVIAVLLFGYSLWLLDPDFFKAIAPLVKGLLL